ncbi:MAG: hypothetical protein AAGC70_00535 [Pseudomonadota bacterium]
MDRLAPRHILGRFITVVLALSALTTPGRTQTAEPPERAPAPIVEDYDPALAPVSPRIGTIARKLRLAVWTADPEAAPPPKTVETRWRTSFGAERRSQRQFTFARTGLQADVIAIRGLTQLQHLRQLFHARDYFVIPSRQMRAAALHARSGLAAPAAGTVALAVRRRGGFRVSRTVNVTLHPPANRGSGTASTRQGRAVGQGTSDAIGVRITGGGRVFWLLIADLSADCKDQTLCWSRERRLAVLRSWIAKIRRYGHDVVTVVAGARFDTTTDPDAKTFSRRFRGTPSDDLACRPTDLVITRWPGRALAPGWHDGALWAKAGQSALCTLIVQADLNPPSRRQPKPRARPRSTSQPGTWRSNVVRDRTD